VSGSPFVFSEGDNSSVIALSADDRFAFISNQNSRTVSSFSIGASGALTLVPPLVQIPDVFPAGPSTPIGLTVDAAGRFLFEANSTNTVGSLQIGANGSLTQAPGTPVSTGYAGFGLGSVAAYPAKSCCAAPTVTNLAASPNSLWPPNHKLVPVALQYDVSAECAVRTQVTVTGSDPADQVVVDNHHLLLRADKDKVYTITVTATNVINRETGSATMQIVVPHDQGH
jgi:Lactonase, 7-bladed beta-propeller